MIVNCPWMQNKICEKNKCFHFVRYLIPYIDEETDKTVCVVVAGYCTASGFKEEVAEGYC